MRRLFPLILLLLLPLSASAQAYRAENWLLVVPLNPQDFEVIEDHGEGARGIWCAAADYAQAVLGLPGDHRLYIKGPRGAALSGLGRRGVVFTIDPARLAQEPQRSYAISVTRAGESLPSHHARQFCKDDQLEPEDF